MRRGRRANALSLQATMPPFLPVWLTGDSYGAVSAYSLLSTPISRRSSLVLTGRWRDAIGDALSSTHRRAPREMQRLEDEPDLKRGPGGLRDLRRAIWANTPASARPMSLTQAPLIEAHRFLWLVRCHLHFLAGRADDRLSLPLQPGNALQNSAAPHLLDLFR